MEIFIAIIKWENGGYKRPVLIRNKGNDYYEIYPITSRYNRNVYTNRIHYFKILKWKECGLCKESYIDTSKLVIIHKSMIYNRIGRLEVMDMIRLDIFINNKNNSIAIKY